MKTHPIHPLLLLVLMLIATLGSIQPRSAFSLTTPCMFPCLPAALGVPVAGIWMRAPAGHCRESRHPDVLHPNDQKINNR